MGLIQLLTHDIFSDTYKGLGIQDFCTDFADMIQDLQRDPCLSKVEAGPHMLRHLKKHQLSKCKQLSKALSFLQVLKENVFVSME